MLQHVPRGHKKYSILKNQLFPPAGGTPLEAAAKNIQFQSAVEIGSPRKLAIEEKTHPKMSFLTKDEIVGGSEVSPLITA
jgi:hypothetical protein